jgi:hypothetical protein
MIIVIQCAASKRADAGSFRITSGLPLLFVADPQIAPPRGDCVYARPDDPSESGRSWREELLAYNKAPKGNPLRLSRAFELYENDTYRHVVRQYGVNKVYILSAGWGLIGADFLTPMYDITFSAAADSYKIRRKRHQYSDLCLLPADTDDDIVFFGGNDYTPLFCSLTRPMRTRKTIFYNSQSPPEAPGCVLQRFATLMRTNWHYECARAFLAGKIKIG